MVPTKPAMKSKDTKDTCWRQRGRGGISTGVPPAELNSLRGDIVQCQVHLPGQVPSSSVEGPMLVRSTLHCTLLEASQPDRVRIMASHSLQVRIYQH